MSNPKSYIVESQKITALALYATRYGFEEAQKIAKQQGINLDKTTALRIIGAIFGDEVAVEYKLNWNKSFMDSLDDFIINKRFVTSSVTEAPQLTKSVPSSTSIISRLKSSLTYQIKRFSAQQIWEFTPSAALRSSGGNTWKITTDLEENTIYLWLKLRSDSNLNVPTTKNAIQLFIDGQEVDDFDFSTDGPKEICLQFEVSDEYISHAKEKGCAVVYDDTLKELVVMLGKEFEPSESGDGVTKHT
jgi:hypothetical protein